MRARSETDFSVDLPDVGRFFYARRTYGDRIKIRSAYLELLGRADDDGLDDDLATMAAIIAGHRVLCSGAPAGWEELASLDLVEVPEREGQILVLYALMRAKEDSFRRVPAAPSPG